ncbi:MULTISPECIES: DUF2147 domain-containing protein [unclassified Bradyrhizobium]|uniref:DUF2147 domain-containing protein n=1 Tax=unclassified Bradyrhizobium TaxID=2631580 RepID=UPI002916A597|nr:MULTISPECIES: DUF2147 domain-containing protein [unclassified Bradyrhizobium]
MSTADALCIAAALSIAISQPAPAGERLTGTWLTEDGSTHVTFKSCGDMDCGQIVWLREPIDPETGKAWQDKLNPDASLRQQPLVGLTMITGLMENSPNTWTGTLYNPLDGKSYAGHFLMLSAAKLELKGCTLAGLICQTETWVRVK